MAQSTELRRKCVFMLSKEQGCLTVEGNIALDSGGKGFHC